MTLTNKHLKQRYSKAQTLFPDFHEMFKEMSLNNLTETKVRQIAEDSLFKPQSHLHCTGIEMGPELRKLLIFSMFSTITILLIVKSTSDGLLTPRD